MSGKIKIPYAVGSYDQIVNEGYYFVDKTQYIKELENYSAPVFLRPRRFGKTLLCSILECYYDINRKDKFEHLFGNTWIGKNPTKEKNTCMVMRFNFSKVQVSNKIDDIEQNFISVCSSAFQSFFSHYKNYLKDFELSGANATNMLEKTLSIVKNNNLPPLYIIIDEYDNFTNQLIQSHNDSMYGALTTGDSFLRTFFKVVKAGIEEQSIRHCYITGVLPITIDDLTSGFNIAEILTLEKKFLSMLGFTQEEVVTYLEAVFESYGFDKANIEAIKVLLKKYYNGYRFGVDAIPLYNSTILTFFLKKFVTNDGEIPAEFIDDNVKTDVSWIKRLTVREENTREMLEKLIFNGELEYDNGMISSKFNMNSFFDKDFYPVSLFYLGMITFKDDYMMTFPNQTMKKIFADYFNEVENIDVSKGYTKYFAQFMKDLDLEKLFAGYFETYIGRIPAQCFDKANENFFRTTFYELCTRYLSRKFTFTVETNYPSGRSDWEMLGKYHTEFKNMKWLVEFKHFSKKDAAQKKIAELEAPFSDDIEQILGYEKDILADFPEYKIRKHIIYTISAESFRFFTVEK